MPLSSRIAALLKLRHILISRIQILEVKRLVFVNLLGNRTTFVM